MLSLELKCSGWRMRKQDFLPFCQMDQYYRKCCESETLGCGSESGSLFHFDTNPDPTFPFDPDPAPYQICHHWYIDLPRLQFWNSMTQLWASIRGLQCFKLNGNHTENDRYCQKNNFLHFAKCLKMYSFFRICILRLQKVLLWPKNLWRRILCWFQIRWCRLKQMPLKKAWAKKLCEFWVFSFLCLFPWFFAVNFC